MSKRPKKGDQGMTTMERGEEGPGGGDEGDEGFTTLMIGEEAPARPAEEEVTTLAKGEEQAPDRGAPTKKQGEEAVTTAAVGEEAGGKGGGGGGNPFGRF